MIGGTKEGEYQRTVEMLEEKVRDGDLTHLLWLLHDSGYTTPDLKRLAEIAQSRIKTNDERFLAEFQLRRRT